MTEITILIPSDCLSKSSTLSSAKDGSGRLAGQNIRAVIFLHQNRKACISLHAIKESLSTGKIFQLSPLIILNKIVSKIKYNVEKSYVDRLDARKPRDFNLFKTSHEFFVSISRSETSLLKLNIALLIGVLYL